MPVKIRLTRTGKKKQPSYRVVVMDSRKPRDGKYIEQIGRYDARQDPSLVEINNERALVWLHQGAQPTERAQKLLEISGAWAQFRVDKGEIHTIEDHRTAEYPEKSAIVEVLTDEVTTSEPLGEEAMDVDQLPVASEEAPEGQAGTPSELVSDGQEAAAEEVLEEAVEEAKAEAVAEAVEEAKAEAVEEAVEGDSA